MTGPRRWLGLIAALSVLLCAGCIKVNMDVAVAPDLSTSARLAAAIDTSLAEMAQGEGGAFSDLKDAPGKHWTTREYQEDGWTVTEAIGHAGPGEALFPDEADAPKLRVQTSQRRLSLRYDISLVTPPPPPQLTQPAPPQQPGEKPEKDEEGGPDLSGLASAMMPQIEIGISLRGPGEVIATTGTEVGTGQAEWKLSLADLQGKAAMPDCRLTTEIPDWLNIGRLASQLVMRGGPTDAGMRLASAVQRGLLPNPPVSATAAEKLSAIDYLRLLEIIGKLDAGAGPLVTEAIVEQFRLNDEGMTSAKIAAVHGKLMKLDVGTTVERAAIRGLADALK